MIFGETYSASIGITHAAKQQPAPVVPAILVRAYDFSKNGEILIMSVVSIWEAEGIAEGRLIVLTLSFVSK